MVSNPLRPHRLQHSRLPCPLLSPGVCLNSCLSSWWCYLTISSSATPFFFCLQSYQASGSFPLSQLFTSGVQNIEVSVLGSVLPMSFQGWFPLGLAGLISLQSKGLSRVFSSTTIQKHFHTGISKRYFPKSLGDTMVCLMDLWWFMPLWQPWGMSLWLNHAALFLAMFLTNVFHDLNKGIG